MKEKLRPSGKSTPLGLFLKGAGGARSGGATKGHFEAKAFAILGGHQARLVTTSRLWCVSNITRAGRLYQKEISHSLSLHSLESTAQAKSTYRKICRQGDSGRALVRE